MRNLAHPYKQVREAIGSNINMIMQLRWTAPSKPSVEDLLHSSGGVEITWTSSDDDLSDLLKCVGGGSSMESKKVYTNTSKTGIYTNCAQEGLNFLNIFVFFKKYYAGYMTR